MSGRPRRAAAGRTSTDPDADPDFLALSARQQQAVDRAFERGVRASGSRKRKRGDVASLGGAGTGSAERTGAEEGGGFVDDEGGFLPDDDGDAGGGFIPDDGGGFIPDDEDGGGFIPDDDAGGFLPDSPEADASKATGEAAETDGPRSTDRVPLHLIPGLLGSLGLPSDDDVLAVFKASASGWEEEDESGSGAGRRGRREGEDVQASVGVGKKDFRAVCAALMGPDEGGPLPESEEESEDEAYKLSESDLSEADSASSFGDGEQAAKGKSAKGKEKAAVPGSVRRARRIKAVDEGPVRLSSRQKEMVADIWRMVKPGADSGAAGSKVLGRNEVKALVRDLGEMWTEDEITDMVTLFSSQHEGRGLSYDDFSSVMLRAGLV